MVERVVVAVDGGPASAAAIDWVVDRAGSVDLEVDVTTVVEIGWTPPGGPQVDYRTAYEQALWSASKTVSNGSPTTTVTTTFRRGVPAQQLIAASVSADLVVIGTNKTGAMVGVAHGTLPLRVAGRSRCPVVVVPVNWSRREGNVVVGWEDDGTAEVALRFAADEAERSGADLTVVHAWQLPRTIAVDGGAVMLFYDELLEHHTKSLADAAHVLSVSHPGLVVEQRLVSDPAGMALVDAARDARLVVVGSHGRGAVGSLILGSVSHDVLLNMPCPVAVVPDSREPIEVLPEIVDEELI